MIVVAGFNSAIDTCADAAAVRAGDVVRLSRVERYPGGKGVHVAQTCAQLGAPVRLVGLVDDEHAPLFERVLGERRVEFRGVRTAGRLRTCYAIRDAHGIVTELLEPGATIEPAVVAQLENAFADASSGSAANNVSDATDARHVAGVSDVRHVSDVSNLADVSDVADVVVMSGSLPAGCPADMYARLAARARRDGVRHVIVDTSGAALKEAVVRPAAGVSASSASALPTVVKPNHEEAARLIGHAIDTIAEAFEAARAIAAFGICRVVISLGDEGAAVCWDGRLARLDVPRQIAISAVGSGDCFVGGLAVAIVRGESADDTLKLAGACGAANVLTREPGWFAPADVERLARVVRVTWQ